MEFRNSSGRIILRATWRMSLNDKESQCVVLGKLTGNEYTSKRNSDCIVFEINNDR